MGDGTTTEVADVESVSTFNLLASIDCSAKNGQMDNKMAIIKEWKSLVLSQSGHILVGSSGIMCFESSLFILNMSVLSVSKTKRKASSQMIFLLLLGS